MRVDWFYRICAAVAALSLLVMAFGPHLRPVEVRASGSSQDMREVVRSLNEIQRELSAARREGVRARLQDKVEVRTGFGDVIRIEQREE